MVSKRAVEKMLMGPHLKDFAVHVRFPGWPAMRFVVEALWPGEAELVVRRRTGNWWPSGTEVRVEEVK